mmetsp:Transcript_13274/g.25453  ORF Transcript_13274/g.25453 Transcript_13274/m.25453 type:complete len:112 (-) Transcript_13274:97-432(-)
MYAMRKNRTLSSPGRRGFFAGTSGAGVAAGTPGAASHLVTRHFRVWLRLIIVPCTCGFDIFRQADFEVRTELSDILGTTRLDNRFEAPERVGKAIACGIDPLIQIMLSTLK